MLINLSLKTDFKKERISFIEIIQDILNAFYGKPEFAFFTQPDGQIFIMIFVYVFNILLVSFLVAMFINRYSFLWGNLDALKRMNIIKLKNTSDYNPLYGGVTITFFPISLIILPFIPFVVLFKSQRLNEFILKMQYAIMVAMYCLIGIVLAMPVIPIYYAKCVSNSLYIAVNK